MVLTAAAFAAGAGTARACGPDSDCAIGDRSYRIFVPDRPSAAPPPGAIVFVHGYRGKAANEMRNPALLALATELDVALIAPQSAGDDWNLPGAPGAAAIATDDDELAYFDALMADATARFGLDRTRVLMSGFSAGGMMAWTLACQRGGDYAGFAPMSGTFWRPTPASCASGPVDLVHYHGTNDTTVPMDGRAIDDARQGDVQTVLEMMRRTNGYAPATPRTSGELRCDVSRTPDGQRLELCLFEGGHDFRTQNIADAWRHLGLADR